MLKKIITFFIVTLVFFTNIYARDYKYIEIFDPKQDKVVKAVQLDSKLELAIESYLKNAQDFYGKNDPFTDDGYVIKIPLTHEVKVNNKYISSVSEEYFIIIPEKQLPFMLLFDKDKRAICIVFHGDIKELSRMLDFKLYH